MRFSKVLLGTALAATAAPAALAQQRVVVPLTDPSRPATLDVSLFMGEVTVTAYDGNEIVVMFDGDRDDGFGRDDDERQRERERDRDDDDEGRRAGLTRITNTAMGLTAEERDNTVSVRLDFSPRNADLQISVPRRTSVRAAVVNGGDVVVSGVTGEHELTNVNGDVIVTDISGGAVIGTTNGDVRATFTEIARDKPMSFSSFNGDVDVTLPANVAADLNVNSGRGDLYTDFEVELQPQPAVVEPGRDSGGRQRWRLERGMRAIVGGGGPEIRLRTFNGDIMVRRGN